MQNSMRDVPGITGLRSAAQTLRCDVTWNAGYSLPKLQERDKDLKENPISDPLRCEEL